MKHTSTPTMIAANGQEIKQHGTPEFPCARYSARQTVQVPWHWHDEYECTVVSGGSVYCNTPQGHFLLHAGDGIFLNSGTLHSSETAENENCQKTDLVFHGRIVYGSADSVFYRKYIQPLSAPDAPQTLVLRHTIAWQAEILENIKKAARLCQNRPEGYEFSVRNLLSEILFEVYCYSNAPSDDVLTGRTAENDRVKQMILYLQAHYAEPVTLAGLAAHVNICERECLRCFKRVLRLSPIQYLIRYRIARACILLREPELSVLEIANRCGFESPSYFTKTFREIAGCTPTEYRKRGHR